LSVLDVACGLNPRGDVNVDLVEMKSIHRRKGKGPMLKTDEIPGFTNADALDMHMFTDRQFPRVHCWHLAEHIEDWRKTGKRALEGHRWTFNNSYTEPALAYFSPSEKKQGSYQQL